MNPDEVRRSPLFDEFEEAVASGDRRRIKQLLGPVQKARASEDRSFALWFWNVHEENLEGALAAAREGVEKFPGSGDLQHSLGWTLFQLERPEEALPHLEEACFLLDGNPDAWHTLALAREDTGDLAGMRQAFREVWEIDQDTEAPSTTSEDELVAWAEEALAELPEAMRLAVRDVAILVQPYPDAWLLESEPWDPRLFGLFCGATHSDLHATAPVLEAPVIYLFSRNLEREFGDDPEEMAEQVRITVHHEIGHFLGLDEDQLSERGLG